MSQHRFKPALLRADWTVTLTDTRMDVTTPNGSGDWSLDLTQVTHLAYAQITVGKTTSRTLDIDTPTGRQRLAQTTDAGEKGPFSQAYLECVLDLLRHLHALHPELHITYGMRGGARHAMFGIAVLCLLMGLGLPIAALASGVDDQRLLAAALPSLLLIGLGLAFGWSNRPWQAPPRLPLARLIAAL